MHADRQKWVKQELAASVSALMMRRCGLMGEYNINDIRDHYTVVMRHKTDFDGMPERCAHLYSRRIYQNIQAMKQALEAPELALGNINPERGFVTS